MNSVPPPIPPQSKAPVTGKNTFQGPIVLVGILMLLFSLIMLAINLFQIREMVSFMFSSFGGSFLFRYILANHSAYLMILVAGFTGIGILARWRIAYGTGLGLSIMGILLLVFVWIYYGSGMWGLGSLMGMELLYLAFLLFQIILFVGTIVLFSNKKGRAYFKVGTEWIGIGIGIGVLLLIDSIICQTLLMPMIF